MNALESKNISKIDPMWHENGPGNATNWLQSRITCRNPREKTAKKRRRKEERAKKKERTDREDKQESQDREERADGKEREER